jgi:hypothetical protein
MSEQIVTTRTAGATRRAWVRRKRIFYTIVGIYLSLSLCSLRLRVERSGRDRGVE